MTSGVQQTLTTTENQRLTSRDRHRLCLTDVALRMAKLLPCKVALHRMDGIPRYRVETREVRALVREMVIQERQVEDLD